MTKIICISCPVGCDMEVEERGLIVKGNQCPAGIEYAQEELTNPTRNIATSVRVDGGNMPMLSVKTARPVPKARIMDVVKAVHKVTVVAPVKVGDVILADAAGTGVDLVATRNVLGNTNIPSNG